MASGDDIGVFFPNSPQINSTDNVLLNISNGSESNYTVESLSLRHSLTDYLAFHRHVPELPNDINGKIITGFTVFDATMIFIILFVIACVKDKQITEQVSDISDISFIEQQMYYIMSS